MGWNGRLRSIQAIMTGIVLVGMLATGLFDGGWTAVGLLVVAATVWFLHAVVSTMRMRATGDASAIWMSGALACLLVYAWLVNVRTGAPVQGVMAVTIGTMAMIAFFLAMVVSLRLATTHSEREISRIRAEAALYGFDEGTDRKTEKDLE